ncbi:MAG: asparagine synthase (glutamine-hydrolyzing) [Planctomycetota bacterium]
MCGLAGILRIHDPSSSESNGPIPHHLDAIPEAWLDVLDDSITHRGPDGQGRFRDRATREDGLVVDVAFVHRRLSIIDHAGGHQPMVHDGQRLRPDLTYQPGETPKLASEIEPDKPLVAVVFNGCIYNHRELRAELEALGHRFETDHSDTEVLVRGWEQWDVDLHQRLDGMFAVLGWRRRDEMYLFMRDRFGEKPLWGGVERSTLTRIESSSAAGIERIIFGVGQPGRPLELPQIQDGTVDDIGSVDCVFPGKVMQTRNRGSDFKEYNHVVAASRNTAVQVGQLHLLVERGITSRLEADVPLGVFLSGGIDSALIAAIAKRHRPDVKTFTVRMPEGAFDESEEAAETAAHIGTDHHTLDCDLSSPTGPADDLVMLIEQLGLPFGDSSLLPTYWVSKAAREHVKVALSGDGGDELFGGYRRHTINPILNRWRRLLRLIPTRLLDRRTPGTRSEYLARLATAARFSGYTELLAIFQTPDLRRLLPSIDSGTVGDDTFRPIEDPLRHDFEHYLPDDLLRKTDTASMAVALEVRAPFLARELVEAALRTPLDVLMPNGQRKGLLKRIAREYLPEHIVDRPKRGFAIPIGDWFRSDFGGLRTLLYDHLESTEPFPGLPEAGVEIEMSFVKQMLREHDAAGERSISPWRGRDHSQRLFMLLVLSIWSKWLAGLNRSPPAERGV